MGTLRATILSVLPLAAALLVPSAVLRAQPQPSATISMVIDSTRAAAQLARLADTLPRFDAVLQRQFAILDRRALDTLSVSLVGAEWMQHAVNGKRAPFAEIARWRPSRPKALLSAAEQTAIDSLATIAIQLLPSLLDVRVGEDRADQLLAPLRAFNTSRLQASLSQSLEKLRRYEQRFGPTSPKLNIAEVALNYVAQSLPPFRPSAEGWPSAFEVVASYVPTYLTLREGNGTAWTVLEAGVRVYVYDEGWGREGPLGILKPSHFAAGIAFANNMPGALRAPWNNGTAVGAFFSWGSAKVAIIGGDQPRLLVTAQRQLIPWVF